MKATAYSSTVEETIQIAKALACCLKPGDVVVLKGDLGAGKTQFVQGVARALGVKAQVTSPTFNILLSYPTAGGLMLNHFDLYRLEDAAELEDIGFYEVLEGENVAFIEWGDKFPQELPDDYLSVSIVHGDTQKGFIAPSGSERTIIAKAEGNRSKTLLKAWMLDA